MCGCLSVSCSVCGISRLMFAMGAGWESEVLYVTCDCMDDSPIWVDTLVELTTFRHHLHDVFDRDVIERKQQ